VWKDFDVPTCTGVGVSDAVREQCMDGIGGGYRPLRTPCAANRSSDMVRTGRRFQPSRRCEERTVARKRDNHGEQKTARKHRSAARVAASAVGIKSNLSSRMRGRKEGILGKHAHAEEVQVNGAAGR